MTVQKNKLYVKRYQPFIKWVGGKRGLFVRYQGIYL